MTAAQIPAPTLSIWLQAFRPKTLTAAIVPIFAATALTAFHGIHIQYWIPFLALICSVFIQIATNLVNDAADFRRGADTVDRLGPRRVTQAGIFSEKAVMMVAGLFFLGAALAGIPLVIQGGWPIFWIGVLSMISGYAYTAGPFPLAYRGLGDFFVVVFFGVVAVTGLYFLLTRTWSWAAVVLGLQVGFHCAVLIAINNLRDIQGDTLVGKKTLPVRFGKTFARFEILVLLAVPFLLNIYWMEHQAMWAGILGLIVLPLAISIAWKVFTLEPSPTYNRLLGQSAAVHLGFGVMTSVGLFLCQ